MESPRQEREGGGDGGESGGGEGSGSGATVAAAVRGRRAVVDTRVARGGEGEGCGEDGESG